MPWTMLDDGFPDHPKMLELTIEQVGMWVLIVNYCNRYLTDGELRTAALDRISPQTPTAKKKKLMEILVKAGLIDTTPTGWAVHDFHDYQLSAAEVKDRRQKRAEAGRKGGLRSGQTRRGENEATASKQVLQANAQANRSSNGVEPHPIPSHPNPLVANESSISRLRAVANTGETEGVIHSALKILAELDYDKAASKGTIRKPDAYFAACLTDRTATDRPELERLHEQHPDLDGDALAHRLEADRWLA